jgi:hypothetical protein
LDYRYLLISDGKRVSAKGLSCSVFENQPLINIKRVIRSSPVAGLCYDTPSGAGILFPADPPDKTSDALSEDFYQEKRPSKPLGERKKNDTN